MIDNLSALEREVEQARTKLATDLAVLRSPQPYRKLRAGLQSDARSMFERLLDDLKARAAANPSAALAIGAGIGWKLWKEPPIATALIASGLLSLWRTRAIPADGQDYLEVAQKRFGEQIRSAADAAKEYGAEGVAAAREKVGAYAHSAGETLGRLATSAIEEAAEGMDYGRATASHIADRLNAAPHNQFDRVGDDGIRDQLLLGCAGLAVAAALGMAYQRRSSSK
jgi:hypothetical protein